MPLQLAAGAISAFPAAYLGYLVVVRHVHPTLPLALCSVAVALLPWLSHLGARASYRAKCDDVAVHARGEALPYKTITGVRIERNYRRRVLVLERGETVELRLVLWDAFAGRLAPLDALATHLQAHGHPIPND